MPSPDYPVVEVEWNDAWSDHDHSSPTQWEESWPVVTVGYLLDEDVSDVFHVAQEFHSSNDTFRCTSHIPAKYVTSWRLVYRPSGFTGLKLNHGDT